MAIGLLHQSEAAGDDPVPRGSPMIILRVRWLWPSFVLMYMYRRLQAQGVNSTKKAALTALGYYVGLCMGVSGVTSYLFPIPRPQKLSQLDKSRIRNGPWGVRNFRDFGGLFTSDGKRKIKKGLLYRSGALHRHWGGGPEFKCIVDLRHPREIEAQPNRKVAERMQCLRVDMLTRDEIGKLGLKGSSADLEFVFNPVSLLRARRGFSLVNCVAEIPTRIMNTVGHDSAVSKLIKLAADPANHPLDLHCREGKDRCGTMSAILLLALGVSENDVLHDYTLSNTLLYRSTVWRLFLARAAWLLVGAWDSFLLDTRAAKTIMRVDRTWLSSAIAETHARYGGLTAGYWNAMGVSAADLQALRQVCLEEC